MQEIKIADLSRRFQSVIFAWRREIRTCALAMPGVRVWIRSDAGQDGRYVLGGVS
jgi:hypothetical protein